MSLIPRGNVRPKSLYHRRTARVKGAVLSNADGVSVCMYCCLNYTLLCSVYTCGTPTAGGSRPTHATLAACARKIIILRMLRKLASEGR